MRRDRRQESVAIPTIPPKKRRGQTTMVCYNEENNTLIFLSIS